MMRRRFTAKDIEDIKKMRDEGLMQYEIAKKYGLNLASLKGRATRNKALADAIKPTVTSEERANKIRAEAKISGKIITKKGSIENRGRAYSNPELMAWRLAEYIFQTYTNERKLTLNGMCRALLISESTLNKYANGEFDEYTEKNLNTNTREYKGREKDCKYDILEYRQMQELFPYISYLIGRTSKAQNIKDILSVFNSDEPPTYSDILGNARLILNEEVEELLADKGHLGSIMRAKVILKWQDETVTTRRYEVCSKDEATKALQELGYAKLQEPLE